MRLPDILKRRSGEKPRPLFFEIGGSDLPPRGMWEAVLASDGLATLRVDSMRRVSDYYNALEILLSKYAAMIAFAEEEIIPFEEMDAFYQPSATT